MHLSHPFSHFAGVCSPIIARLQSLPPDLRQTDRLASAKDIVRHLCRSFMLLEGGNKVEYCRLCWLILWGLAKLLIIFWVYFFFLVFPNHGVIA